MKQESIYDFEATHVASYFPEHRKASEIKAELSLCAVPRQKLELKLELAESELHHFCMANMFLHRGADYIDFYVTPKRKLDQKRIEANAQLVEFQKYNGQ